MKSIQGRSKACPECFYELIRADDLSEFCLRDMIVPGKIHYQRQNNEECQRSDKKTAGLEVQEEVNESI